MLDSSAFPLVEQAAGVHEHVHVAVSVWFCLHAPPVVIFERKFRVVVRKARDFFLLDERYVVSP